MLPAKIRLFAHISFACAALVLSGSAGCTPRVHVTANPGPQAKGIRYYRPKPYLKIVPAEIQIAKDASRIEPGLVKITLEYLPDFTEEYAIDVRSGFGIADVSITLEDGWNLTELNQDLDSQTHDNISAAGDLIKAVSGLVPTAAGAAQSPDIEFTVPATDVPLGFYESVIGRGPDGRKRLYGFRYLGFLPYQPCPTVMGGIDMACCNDPAATLYGLTFAGGRMVFRPLPLMAAEPSEAAAAPSDSATIERSSLDGRHPEPILRPDAEHAARVALDMRSELIGSYPSIRQVNAHWQRRGDADILSILIRTSDGVALDAIRRLASELLEEDSAGSYLYDVEVE